MDTIWVEARIAAPQEGGPWYGDTFREYVASRLQGDEWRSLFWMDKEGKPRPGRPLTTFVAGRNWVGLRVFTGKQDLVDQAKGDAVTMLRAALQVARSMDDDFSGRHHLETRQGQIKITEKRTSYHIRKLAIRCKVMRADMHAFAKQITKDAPVDETTRGITADMIGRHMAEELPMLSNVRPSLSKKEGCLQWGTPALVGGKELVFVIKNVVFTLPVRITGPVQVGALTSRGYGDVRQITGGVSND